MSESTVISIVPFPITEFKPGIYPGLFNIPESKNEVPQVLIVGNSKYHVEVDENQTITITCDSSEIARSIVDDYLISNLEFSVKNESSPGIMWKSGAYSPEVIVTKFKDEIVELKRKQWNWFKALVQLADDDWERTRQHKSISDMQRFAAKALKIDRPWIIDIGKMDANIAVLKCPACQSVIPSTAIVCANCRCILNKTEYDKLQFADVKK